VKPDGTVSAPFGAGGVDPAGFVDAVLPSQPVPGGVELDDELPPPASTEAVADEVVAADDREPDVVADEAALDEPLPPSTPAARFVASELPQATRPSTAGAHESATSPRIERMFTSASREDTARPGLLRATSLRIARRCSELAQGHAG
jgi:hypothetical protein